MRLLLASELYPPVVGGLELHVQALGRELARRGHEVAVATVATDRSPSVRAEDGVIVHRLPSASAHARCLLADPGRPFLPPVRDPLLARGIAAVSRALRPQVVHAHNWIVASCPRDVPLVLTAHDYAWICPKRNRLRPDGSTCTRPGLLRCVPCAAGQYGAAKGAALSLLTPAGRWAVRPDRQLAVSQAVADALAPWARRPVTVVPNFVSDGFAAGATEPVPGLPAAPFALFAGAALPHKGIDTLLEAWAGEPPCPLVVAALKPGTRHWPPGVQVVTLDRGQMAAACRQAAVVVVPSRWADPCPTVALEALAAGTPVIASAVGGLTEIVVDGGNGMLVPPGDATALRTAVAALVGDPGRRRAMAAEAAGSVARYRAGHVADLLEAVYAEAAA